MKSESGARRLDPLDTMRGIAALLVVVFHYQHFGGDKATYPWATLDPMAWVYARGWILVDFFFLLSGIVLTHRYWSPISTGRMPWREFAVLRLSRLYPLHVLMLLVCACIQWSRLIIGQPEIIYRDNDLYHLFLNLVYLQSGVFQFGWSYDAPSWSVAVEVVCYILFFVYASKWSKGTYAAVGCCTIVGGLAVLRLEWNLPFLNEQVARGVMGFFGGSLVYFAIGRLKEAGRTPWLAWLAPLATLTVFALISWIGYARFIGDTSRPLLLVVFPLVIVSGLECPPLAWVLSLRPLTFLGDLAYTVYLTHAPVQMVMLWLMEKSAYQPPVAKPLFMGAFLVIVLTVSVIVHRCFELPARRWLRMAGLSGKSPIAT